MEGPTHGNSEAGDTWRSKETAVIGEVNCWRFKALLSYENRWGRIVIETSVSYVCVLEY